MIDYDLVIVGAGSGNMLPTAGLDGLRVAIIERDRFGGTSLNRGCIPSKMLVYAADVAETVRHAGRYGIRAELVGADWPAIRDRVFARIDPLSEQAVAFRRPALAATPVGRALRQDDARESALHAPSAFAALLAARVPTHLTVDSITTRAENQPMARDRPVEGG